MRNSVFMLFLLLNLIESGTGRADWINLTGAETAPNIAEIYILDDQVKVVMEVYIGDLEAFDDLIPDDWINDSDRQRLSLAKRLQHFADKTFQIVTEKGEKLSVNLILVEARQRIDRQSPFAGMINPYTRRRVPDAPADKRVLYAQLSFPFTDKPSELTFIPPLNDQGRSEVTLGFIAYHKAVPVIDFRYLSAPAHLQLDWDDPWYSKFDNPNLKRHHKAALMSFLYVEPYEVRHEILLRVRDLDTWLNLGLENKRYIETEELETIKQQIGDFLLDRNPVLVDGQALHPILDRINFIKVGIKGLEILENPQRLEVSTAIIGVIISYSTEGIPQQVTMEWDLFNDQIKRVPTTATDPAGPLPSFVTPDDAVLIWNNFLKNYQLPTVVEVDVNDNLTQKTVPLLSLLCLLIVLPLLWLIWNRYQTRQAVIYPAITCLLLLVLSVVSYSTIRIAMPVPDAMATKLNAQQQQALLHTLLKNVYRAFDFRKEEDVYDKLAVSVSGDLLTDIYLQNRKSFAIKKAGGAQAKVNNVEILDIVAEPLEEALTYNFKVRWTATGSVGHWGHVHTRKNLYDAIIKVKAVDGSWKITGLELLEEKRIDPMAKGNSSERPTQG